MGWPSTRRTVAPPDPLPLQNRRVCAWGLVPSRQCRPLHPGVTGLATSQTRYAVSEVVLYNSECMIVSKYFSKEGQTPDIGCGARLATIALHRLLDIARSGTGRRPMERGS